jgi:RNA polymerase sigma-70 factor (ECF subfamily)
MSSIIQRSRVAATMRLVDSAFELLRQRNRHYHENAEAHDRETMSRPSRADPTQLQLHLLVLRCQAGDERAFGQLVDRFAARTLAYLRGLTGEEAEDVQQDVWLTVYRSIGGLSNPGGFRTWLFRTTRHRAIDWLRRRKRERELMEDVALELQDAGVTGDADPMPAISAVRFDAMLAGLPPPQREVLLLRYRDEMSYAEIALVVGCPIGTVRTRLHHAKRRLQEQLDRGEP